MSSIQVRCICHLDILFELLRLVRSVLDCIEADHTVAGYIAVAGCSYTGSSDPAERIETCQLQHTVDLQIDSEMRQVVLHVQCIAHSFDLENCSLGSEVEHYDLDSCNHSSGHW